MPPCLSLRLRIPSLVSESFATVADEDEAFPEEGEEEEAALNVLRPPVPEGERPEKKLRFKISLDF